VRVTRIPAAIVPARVMLGSGTVDDGDPRLHDTAAHSLPDGDGAAAVMMVPPPACGGGCDTMDPGTRQLTATAARVTTSHCHLRATDPRLRPPVWWPGAEGIGGVRIWGSGARWEGAGDPGGQRTPLVGPERSRTSQGPHQRLGLEDHHAVDAQGPSD